GVPGRRGVAVELAGLDLEPAVQVVGEGEGGGLADADHPHVPGADDPDLQGGDFDLQGDGRQEAGAAAPQDEDALDHWGPACQKGCERIRRLSTPPAGRRPPTAWRAVVLTLAPLVQYSVGG